MKYIELLELQSKHDSLISSIDELFAETFGLEAKKEMSVLSKVSWAYLSDLITEAEFLELERIYFKP